MSTWHKKHKDSLKLGDRIADGMRNLMGSWAFVIGFLVFLGVWMWSGGFGVDHAPFGLLNLALSTLAGIQASLIMIAAKRLDDMAASQAKHDLEVNIDADERIKEVQGLSKEIHALITEVHLWQKKKLSRTTSPKKTKTSRSRSGLRSSRSH